MKWDSFNNWMGLEESDWAVVKAVFTPVGEENLMQHGSNNYWKN